jgi:hypothetical protein
MTLLCGCDSNALQDIHIPTTLSAFSASDDASIPTIGTNPTIPILLTSNKQNTTFLVNGVVLAEAKSLKVKVPREAIRITAQAPCYRTLEQRAEPDGFGPLSQFEFTFAKWDKVANSGGRDCAS